MLALVSQVFIRSAQRPIDNIKKICLNESGKPVMRKNAGRTATKAVKVIKEPVLNALKIRILRVSSLDFRALDVKSISVSTE
jgi:hypothetical protein